MNIPQPTPTRTLALVLTLLALVGCHAETPVSVDVDLGIESLRVTTETSGEIALEIRYRLEIRGPHTDLEEPFDANESKRFALLHDGTYRLELGDVPLGCRALQPVQEVELHQSTERWVRFAVECRRDV